MITQAHLKSVLHYSPKTGIFVWNDRPNIRPCVNSRFKGKIAGDIQNNGYHRILVDGVRYLSHRLAWLYMKGKFPDIWIDHIDGNRANNIFSNLREATPKQNSSNRGKNKNNTTGYKCVSYHKKANKWETYIIKDGINTHLGLFNCPTAAHFAYCRASKKYQGEFARTE